MSKQISFKLKVASRGISASAVYVAEETVNAPYAVHIEMDGTAIPSPNNLIIEQKSDGSDYVDVLKVSLNTIKGRNYVFDHDFAGEAWPKQVRITTPLPVLSASITTGNASTEDIEQIKAQIKELKGDSNSTAASTPAIDSNKEVSDFLEGFENDQKLKDVLNDVEQPLTDEEMVSLTSMFPTS